MATKCTAPKILSIEPAITEKVANLYWSGASGGTGNSILNYEIQRSDSTNGANWGNWIAHDIVSRPNFASGNIQVNPPARGTVRRFRVRVRGTAGSTYYSDWKISSNTLRRPTPPSAPTAITASPGRYVIPSVTLTWSGAKPGTNPIDQYKIQRLISPNGVNFMEDNERLVSASATSYIDTGVPNDPHIYTKYRVYALDALELQSSGYAQSNTVRKVAPPGVPEIFAPSGKPNAVTYNTNPRILIYAPRDGNPDMFSQTVFVKVNSAGWQNSVTHAASFSRGGVFASAIETIYRPGEIPIGTASVSVKVNNGIVDSEQPTRNFTVASPPIDNFESGTPVKSDHIRVLREMMDKVCSYYGRGSYSWNQEIIPGKTQIRDWPLHVREIRSAIMSLVSNIFAVGGGVSAIDPNIEWLPLGHGRPRADVMNQLVDVIMTL